MRDEILKIVGENPKFSVLEISKKLNLKEFEVLKELPNEFCKVIDGEKYAEILGYLESFGEILFVKNTPSFIIEFKTTIPKGSLARGYYNFSGKSGTLGGHLKFDDIKSIALLTNHFMGMLTKQVGFYDENGENIFKIYLIRDEKMKLVHSQVEKFEELFNKF